MPHLNIEIKAKCSDCEKIRNILKAENADFKGTEHQIDTYFKVNSGRLKLREGNFENELIFYKREEKEGPKQSNITIIKNPDLEIKNILAEAFGILVVVDKQREIYFIKNIKFHIDKVANLGNFMEIEARNCDENIGPEKLMEQCQFYLNLMNIQQADLISCSYSDLLMKKNPNL